MIIRGSGEPKAMILLILLISIYVLVDRLSSSIEGARCLGTSIWRLDLFQGFSRIMSQPADRVRRLSKSSGLSGVGSGGVRHITGRVGSEDVQISRVTLTRPDS